MDDFDAAEQAEAHEMAMDDAAKREAKLLVEVATMRNVVTTGAAVSLAHAAFLHSAETHASWYNEDIIHKGAAFALMDAHAAHDAALAAYTQGKGTNTRPTHSSEEN